MCAQPHVMGRDVASNLWHDAEHLRQWRACSADAFTFAACRARLPQPARACGGAPSGRRRRRQGAAGGAAHRVRALRHTRVAALQRFETCCVRRALAWHAVVCVWCPFSVGSSALRRSAPGTAASRVWAAASQAVARTPRVTGARPSGASRTRICVCHKTRPPLRDCYLVTRSHRGKAQPRRDAS